jgi:glucose-1-phosphate adenylyltransferase
MKSAVGIILAGGKNERLGELTEIRATSALPVGSCYRTIDFSLSNMTNAGIKKVAVITQYNSRSLHDHLSSAKWWNFGSMQGGLFIFTPFLSRSSNFWFRGTADSLFQNMAFLERSNEPFVVIASGDGIYKFDYQKLIDFHIEKGADVTIMCKNLQGMDVRNFGVVTADEDSRITDFEEKPVEPLSSVISLGVYVISRTLLIDLLKQSNKDDRHDFVRDIIVRYRRKLRMHAYRYNGYWATVNNIDSYYNINMDFLNRDIRTHLISNEPYIETKPKDEPPAKYNMGAQVRNALVGSGSIINGRVENSVLFRSVFVGENTTVRNSIIMERCHIGHNCTVENVILDKEVEITDGKGFVGGPGEPHVISKYTVL